MKTGDRVRAGLRAIRLNEVVPLLASDGAEIVVENSGVPEGVEEFHVLINRPRNEIIPLSGGKGQATRSGTVGIGDYGLQLAETKLSDEAFTVWLAQASLVKVVLRLLGHFTRAVESKVEGRTP